MQGARMFGRQTRVAIALRLGLLGVVTPIATGVSGATSGPAHTYV